MGEGVRQIQSQGVGVGMGDGVSTVVHPGVGQGVGVGRLIPDGILDSLLTLPLRYFKEERFKSQLMPTLEIIYAGRKVELDRIFSQRILDSTK